MPIGYLIEKGHITPDSDKCDIEKKVGEFRNWETEIHS